MDPGLLTFALVFLILYIHLLLKVFECEAIKLLRLPADKSHIANITAILRFQLVIYVIQTLLLIMPFDQRLYLDDLGVNGSSV